MFSAPFCHQMVCLSPSSSLRSSYIPAHERKSQTPLGSLDLNVRFNFQGPSEKCQALLAENVQGLECGPPPMVGLPSPSPWPCLLKTAEDRSSVWKRITHVCLDREAMRLLLQTGPSNSAHKRRVMFLPRITNLLMPRKLWRCYRTSLNRGP